MSFYKTTAWRNKRIRILKRDSYECQECKRYGKSRTATTVHHIFPLEHYPEYRLTSANLYSCCNDCHNSFHDRDTHLLTVRGEELKERHRARITPPQAEI